MALKRGYNNRYEIDFRLKLNSYIQEKNIINDNNELEGNGYKVIEDTISLELRE